MRPAELHSRSAEENCSTENVSSLRSVKGATLPCDACASIPCGLAVRKQHEMLFAASKFGKTNTKNQTVDWSHYAKSRRSFLSRVSSEAGPHLPVKVVCSASCYQLASESLVKVIASEPCSEPPMLLGD